MDKEILEHFKERFDLMNNIINQIENQQIISFLGNNFNISLLESDSIVNVHDLLKFDIIHVSVPFQNKETSDLIKSIKTPNKLKLHVSEIHEQWKIFCFNHYDDKILKIYENERRN
jgi:hypothetical protein